MALDHRDRILDWRTELGRLAPELEQLPPAALNAVRAVVEDFVREDERRPAEPPGLLDDAA